MSWLTKQAKSIWADHKTEAFSCVIGLLVLVALVTSSYVTALEPSAAVQSFTLVVLVIVTIVYAKATHKNYEATSDQVNATRDAVDVAINSEQNAVAPLIKLTIDGGTAGFIPIIFENIGNGPALNLVAYLEVAGEQFQYLKSDKEKSKTYQSAFAVEDVSNHQWRENLNISPRRPLPTRDYGFDVVAEYSDVFRQGFISKLEVSKNDQNFVYWQPRNIQ